MNKKFSTLVAALLASGGLFYAVDAMILPAGDGVAKYVKVETRADATGTVVGYKIQTGTFDQAASQSIWKLVAVENEAGKYYLTTGTEAFYLNSSLELKETADGAIKFTLDGARLKSGNQYLAIVDNKLALGAESKALALFTNASAVAEPNVSTGYILGAAVAGAPALVNLSASSESVNWSAAVGGLKGNVINSADYEAANAAKVKVVNGTEGAGSQSFLQVNGTNTVCLLVTTEGAITYGPIPSASDEASVVSISTASDEHQGKVMIGTGKYLKIDETGALSLTAVANDGNVYAATGLAASGVSKKEDAVKANDELVLYAVTGEATTVAPTEGFYLSYAETTPASFDMKVIGGGVSSVFSGLEDAQKFSTNESDQLMAGSDYVVWDGDGSKVTLASAAGSNPFKYIDGVFKADGKTLALTADGVTAVATLDNQSEALVGFSDASTVLTEGSSQSDFVLAVKKTKETIADLTSTSSVILTEAITQPEDAPGIDVPGMAGNVVVSDEGVVTPLSSTTNDVPAPVTVQVASGTYLAVTSNGTVVVTNKAEEADAWVLVDGYFKSVAKEKAGEPNIWLKTVSPNTLSRASYGELIADMGQATLVNNTGSAFTIGGTTLTLTVDSKVAPAATIDAENKANLITGELSNGNVVCLAQGTNYANNKQAYVVEVVETLDGQYQYKFREVGKSTYLTVSNQTVFTSTENEGAGMALKANGQYLTIDANGTTLGDDKLSTAFYKADVSTANFSAKYILEKRGSQSSFNLTLWDEEDGTSDLIQNPFADADLVPMKWNDTKKVFEAAKADEETFLLKKGNNYIVLNADDDDVWGNMGSQVTDGGYKFTTISAATMEKFLKKELTNRHYLPYFTFSYDENGSGLAKDGSLTAKTPIYQISVGSSSNTVGNYKLVSFEIKTGVQKGVYLTVDAAGKNKVYAEFSASNLITGDMNKDYNPLKMKYVNITFVNHPSIRDKKNENVVLNGRVLSANADKSAAANEILASKPEGQWIVSMTDADLDAALSKGGAAVADNKKFTFTNRESGKTYKATSIYYLGNNKYAVTSTNQIAKSADAAISASRDTMIIEPIEASLKNNEIQMDGYANLKASEVQDEQFRLLVASAEEDYYVGENHTAKSHFLGLSHDEEAAVNWRIVPLTAEREYDKDGILKTVSDSIYVVRHPQYYNADKKTYFAYSDTIAIISYALQNTANGEYLTYENPQTTTILSMICDPKFKSFATTKDVKSAYRFVLKEKADGLYNIVSVDGDVTYKDGYTTGEDAHPFSLGDNKLYGATTLTKQGAVEVDNMYNKINSNDLFKVQKVGAPEYRLQNMGDTIRIFRQENDYDVMYEKGEFLNIGNKAQLTNMAPALYVDTAYVNRGSNSRYQYLLMVNPEYKAAVYDNGDHQVKPDTMYGRFLVNLIDTAYVAYKNGAIHSNKYINDGEAGETCAKLGFVYGFRTGDKLYITDKNFKKSGKASDVIDLGTSDFNVAKFAFRYINPVNHESDGSFKIQTGYYGYDSYIAGKKQPEVSNDGYLKNINGVVVVAQGYDKGDKFDLAAEHSNPTANEGINAASFSVATIDGAVVISGAEGKTVVITNVLGQTIASTVITSSEATISVPAGVVVVAVEGEAAVKAIVK